MEPPCPPAPPILYHCSWLRPLVLFNMHGTPPLPRQVLLFTTKDEAPGVFRALALAMKGRGNMAFAWVQVRARACVCYCV